MTHELVLLIWDRDQTDDMNILGIFDLPSGPVACQKEGASHDGEEQTSQVQQSSITPSPETWQTTADQIRSSELLARRGAAGHTEHGGVIPALWQDDEVVRAQLSLAHVSSTVTFEEVRTARRLGSSERSNERKVSEERDRENPRNNMPQFANCRQTRLGSKQSLTHQQVPAHTCTGILLTRSIWNYLL